MATVKLAEALLKRKELNEKVDQVRKLKESDIFHIIIDRKQAHEGLDEIRGRVPVISLSEVTAEYDFYARQLRLVDAAIQYANWTTEIEVNESVFSDFIAPEKIKDDRQILPGRSI